MAKAKAEATTKKKSDEQPPEGELLARELARAIWLQEFKQTNPGADAEVRKADWAENKAVYMKQSRGALRMLARKNIVLHKTEG